MHITLKSKQIIIIIAFIVQQSFRDFIVQPSGFADISGKSEVTS